MENLNRKIAERLRLLREEKKLNQADLAKVLGVSRVSIVNYEKGKRTPDIDFIIKVSEYFFVDVNYLIGKSEFKEIQDYEYTSELVESFMKVFEKMPQPQLQGFLKDLRSFYLELDKPYISDKVKEEFINVMYNCLSGCTQLLTNYESLFRIINAKMTTLINISDLENEYIAQISKEKIPFLYSSAYDIMKYYHETTEKVIKAMIASLEKYIDDIFDNYYK